MSIKKMLLLASMALAAIAFAAPAAAQAESVWLHDGEPLAEPVEIPVTGQAKFTTGFGSFECTVHSALQLEPGSTGEVPFFSPTTSTCVGTGILNGCKLKSHSSTAPWVIETTTDNDAVITDVTIHNVYENCPFVPTTHLEFDEITVTPNNAASISSVTISGETEGGVVASGTLHPTNKSDVKTYGIG